MHPGTPSFDSGESGDAAAHDLGGRAVRGVAWQGLSFGGNRIILFFSTLVLARLLDPADFGVFAGALTFTAFLEVLLDFGVGSYLIYDQGNGFDDRVHTAFWLNLGMTAVLTGLAVVASPFTARLLGAPHRTAVFAVTSLYLVPMGLTQINQSIMQRDLQFKRQVIIALASASVRACVTIALAVEGAGVWAIVVGFLLGQLINLVLYWTLGQYWPRFRFRRDLAREMLTFGIMSTLLDAINWLQLNGDYLVVGAVLGDVALGFYSVAFRLTDLVINSVLWMFSSVAFPIYSRSRQLGANFLGRTMLRALRLTTLYGFAFGVGSAMLSRDAIVVFFGGKWSGAIGSMTVLSLASALDCLGYASGPLFPAIGKPGSLIKISLPLAVVRIAGFILAAPYGIFWVAVVHLIVNLLSGFVRLAYADAVVGTTAAQSMRAVGPAVTVGAGIAVVALPVRLVTGAGWPGLLEVTAAVLAGALLGSVIWGRQVLVDVRRVYAYLAPGH